MSIRYLGNYLPDLMVLLLRSWRQHVLLVLGQLPTRPHGTSTSKSEAACSSGTWVITYQTSCYFYFEVGGSMFIRYLGYLPDLSV